MRSYFNFETMFESLKDGLVNYLKESKIYYELSGCGCGWHFEILCTADEVESIDEWLDENTITEK